MISGKKLPKICILDYGLGNIKSLHNALKKIGCDVDFYSEKKNDKYKFIFIPGVGSFSTGSKKINSKEINNFLNNSIKKNCKIIGICLGMQLFHTTGFENGKNKGLNLIKGDVIKFQNKSILPIIGWKKIFIHNKNEFLNEFNERKFYFVHSYHVKNVEKKNILSYSEYQDEKYISSVIKDNYLGVQFHPEKSGENGLEFLRKVINYF